MYRKAQLDPVTLVGAIILTSLVVLGTIGGYTLASENRFVGDTTNKLYYDLSKCDISKIPKENLKSFTNQVEAIKNGYHPAKCSE